MMTEVRIVVAPAFTRISALLHIVDLNLRLDLDSVGALGFS